MTKIMFTCHGNICRSPMAEFVFWDMVVKRGLEQSFSVDSCAVSREEIGNGVHHGTRKKLREENIPIRDHRAVQLKKSDYKEYDYLIGMEDYNLSGMRRIVGGDPDGKIHRLLDFTNRPRDIADPWYTGNFDVTYQDIREGCEALLEHILKQEK